MLFLSPACYYALLGVSYGCKGGDVCDAMDYLIATDYQFVLEADYLPYSAVKHSTCQRQVCLIISSYKIVNSRKGMGFFLLPISLIVFNLVIHLINKHIAVVKPAVVG